MILPKNPPMQQKINKNKETQTGKWQATPTPSVRIQDHDLASSLLSIVVLQKKSFFWGGGWGEAWETKDGFLHK